MHRIRVLTLCVVIAGCGSQPSSAENFRGDAKAVAQVVEDLQSAARAKDAEEICSRLLTKTLADSIKAGSETCAAELKASLDDVDDFDLEVKKVTVAGSTATAGVEGHDGTGGRLSTLRFVKEGSAWKLSSLS